MATRSRPAFGLRARLVLVALLLLALPWAGYRYVREMERFMLEAQEQSLIATARAVATALHDRPAILHMAPLRDSDLRRQAEEELARIAAEREAPGGSSPSIAGGSLRESAEIAAILKGVERTTSRIWIVTRDLRVLALEGSLKRNPPDAQGVSLLHRLLGWIVPRPSEEFDDAIADDALATGKDVWAALQGTPGSRARNTPDGKAVVISAAHPIWNGDEVFGAVVVEETTNAILSVRGRALERLLAVTLAAFAVAAAVLIWFATGISQRIRRLRDEAETALDARGRLTRLITAQDAGDEIGDLSRSFSAMLGKLSQHHAYLESLASRLSHELRTPLAVVRSSLENLKLAGLPGEARIYIDRAEQGLARLSTILTRMSEATRLEQGLAQVERERFDLASVAEGCVAGYRLAYPGREFDLVLPEGGVTVEGSPDLAAQLLDKLVANAADFAPDGEPVRISLAVANRVAELRVENKGPPLPEELRGRLFDSMISVRGARSGGEPHLGIGLYIARLIAEFHGGAIAAVNLPGGDGVAVSASFLIYNPG